MATRADLTYLETLDENYRTAAFQLVCRDESFARVVIPRLPLGFFAGDLSINKSTKIGEWTWIYEKVRDIFNKSNYRLPKPKALTAYIINEAKRELSRVDEEDRKTVLSLIARHLKLLLTGDPELPFEDVREQISKGIQIYLFGEFIDYSLSVFTVETEELDPAEFDKRYYNAIHGVKQVNTHTSYRESYKNAIYARDNLTRIPTGLPKLDAELLGGAACGELAMLAAETGAGKTTLFAAFAAHAFSKGHKVGYVTLETSGDNVMNMITAYHTRIVRNMLPMAKGKAEERVEKLISTLSADADILINDAGPGGIGASGIRMWLEMMRMSGEAIPEVIFVDYLNNMDLSNKRDQKYVAYRDEITALAGIAHDFNIAVWVATQFNKEGSKKRVPDLTDIAGSWDMLNVPPTILLFYHPEGEKDTNYRYLKVEKTKAGTGQPLFKLFVDFNITKFEETNTKPKGQVVQATFGAQVGDDE